MKHFLIVFCILLSLSSQAKQLNVGWELWYPYQYRNTEQTLLGLDFEILNTIFAKAGVTAHYTELPWKRHLHYIKTGEMDVAMGASLSVERQRYGMFTQPYRKEIVKLYVRKGFSEKIDLSTLAGLQASAYVVGVESGYYYGDDYQELMQTAEFREHIIEVVDIEENVTLLLKGHIDGFLVDPVTIKAFSEKYKMKGEFEQHSLEIYHADIHILLSKKSVSSEIAKKVDQAISQLKASGEIERIINKWSKLN
jgi:polar amino acid transport system substrate-binding protein